MEENQLHVLSRLNDVHSRVSFATGHEGLLSGGPLDAPEYIETGHLEALVDSFCNTIVVSKRVHRLRWSTTS